MRIVDAQIHMFSPDGAERARKLLQKVIEPEAVVAAMDEAGVARAYLVPGGSEANETCLAAVRRWPDRFRVMAIVGLDKPESRETMAAWSATGFAGVRVTFPPYRKVSWLQDGTADWFWPAAEKAGIAVMIWAPNQMDAIDRVAERHRGVRFIIDHMNLFVSDQGQTVKDVVAKLLPLARHPNVAIKASAMPCHSTEPYPFRDLHGVIREVVQAFGSYRVMWGTDLTRMPCTYRQAITFFTEELDFLTPGDREQIMGESALRWIGW
jgi:L-fuconolactonase